MKAQATPMIAAGDSEQDAFDRHQHADRPLRVSERLQDGVLLHPAADDEEHGVRDEPEDGGDRADPEPAGEADQFDELARGLGEECLLGTRAGRLLVGGEGGVDLAGDPVELALTIRRAR